MQNFNYHTHTYRCGHADNNMTDEDYVKEFIKKKFNLIAFTDHNPEKEIIDTRKTMRMDYDEIKGYLNSIKELQEKYKDKIIIKSGFEIEYLPGQEENIQELKEMVDIIILGQHFIYDKNNKDIKIFRWQEFSDNDLITYANYIKKAMELNIPNIIAHPDIFMLSRNSFGKAEEKATRIICEAAEKYNIPLEINLTEPVLYLTKQTRKVKYPCKEFWKIASEYDVKVLYGVDAHYKEQITMYEQSIALANIIIEEDTIKKLKFVYELGE